MAKNAIREYSATAASNTDIGGIAIQGTNVVSNFDNAFRELMAQLADMNGGVDAINDTMTWCDPTDATKKFRFDGVGITTATTRTITMPDASGTMALLGTAQTWGATQTFPTIVISGSTPTITLTDTDTNADSFISASNSSGSVVISADANNEASSSNIFLVIDGNTRATLDANSAFSLSGPAPVINLTDTDTNADSQITASSANGSIGISADINNELSGSAILFSVDGTQRASIDNNGDLNVGTWSTSGATIGWTYDVSAGIVRTSQSTASSAFHYAFYNTNTLVGGISTSASATTYATSSDYRRKPVLEPLTDFWDRINATVPRRFQWDTGQWDWGFLAHEFAVAYPAAVNGEKDAVDSEGTPVYQSMQASTSQVMADIMSALKDIDIRLKAIEGAAS